MKDEKAKIPEETKMQIADRIGKKIKLSDSQISALARTSKEVLQLLEPKL